MALVFAVHEVPGFRPPLMAIIGFMGVLVVICSKMHDLLVESAKAVNRVDVRQAFVVQTNQSMEELMALTSESLLESVARKESGVRGELRQRKPFSDQ